MVSTATGRRLITRLLTPLLVLLLWEVAVRTGVAEAVQVKALLYAASVLHSVDEVERAEALVQEALALARQTGDLASIAFTLLNLGGVAGQPRQQWYVECLIGTNVVSERVVSPN